MTMALPFLKKKKKKDDPENKRASDPTEMSDDEFGEYINDRKSGVPVEPPEPEAEPEDEAEDPSEDAAEDTPAEDAAEAEDAPFKSFKTEAEYKADIDKAIAEARSAWDLDNAAAKKRYARMERISKGFFDSNDAMDRLGDELDAQLADRAGMSLEDYNKKLEYDSFHSASSKQKEIVDKWVADAGNLKVVVPDFSLEEALSIPEFTEALKSGDDVFAAYAKAYKHDPDPEPEPEPESEKKPEREPIPQNGQGKRKGTGSGFKDPSKMSSSDFRKYIDDIRNT